MNSVRSGMSLIRQISRDPLYRSDSGFCAQFR